MNSSMRSALSRLGWGLVFPLINFQSVFFDAFPDIVGYIMIFIALGQLSARDAGFKQTRWLAAAMILLSLPQLVVKSSIDINQLSTAQLGMHAYIQGMGIMHALLAYQIFRGLYTFARPIASPDLLDAIVTRRKLYMTIFVSQLIFYPFLLNMEENWAIMLLFIGILMFIAELLLIRLPFRLSHIRNTPIDFGDKPETTAPL